MSDINEVRLEGNLGGDPELRYSNSGKLVANFRVATNKVWFDKDNNRCQTTEWHRVVAWGRIAEIVQEFCAVGTRVLIKGELKTHKYTGTDEVERYQTQIVASYVRALDKNKQSVDNDDDLLTDEELAAEARLEARLAEVGG